MDNLCVFKQVFRSAMVTYLMPYILFWIGRDLAKLRGVVELLNNRIPIALDERVRL